MNKSAIVTGATGFIGSYLVRELLQNGYRVCAPVRRPDKLKSILKELYHHPYLLVVEADLEENWSEKMPQKDFSIFYHLGWSGVNREEIDDEEIHKKSLHNSIKCLEIAHKLGCDCFVNVGSKAEYGKQDYVQDENVLCKPENAYGKAKLSFYEYAHAYCKTVGMQFCHARLFSVIGVGDHPWSLVSTACRKFAMGEEMHFGSCLQKWNFTAVEDVVKGLRLLAECEIKTDDHGIYNIAGNDTRVLRDFVQEIHRICNSQSSMYFSQEPTNGDFMNPSTERIRKLTGWKEDYTFEESIRRILKECNRKNTNYHKENNEGRNCP